MSPEVANIVVSVVIAMALMNLIILGLNLKLYTEILKEKSQRERVKEPGPLVRELLRPGPVPEPKLTNFRTLPAEVVTARQTKATEWQIHAGNVRQHGRFMASVPDKETMQAAAAALDDAANFLISTTNESLANTWPAQFVYSPPTA